LFSLPGTLRIRKHIVHSPFLLLLDLLPIDTETARAHYVNSFACSTIHRSTISHSIVMRPALLKMLPSWLAPHVFYTYFNAVLVSNALPERVWRVLNYDPKLSYIYCRMNFISMLLSRPCVLDEAGLVLLINQKKRLPAVGIEHFGGWSGRPFDGMEF
jgi:hypothetical protein